MKKIIIGILILSLFLLVACGSTTKKTKLEYGSGDQKIEVETETTSEYASSWCKKATVNVGGYKSEILGVEEIKLDNGKIECKACHTKLIDQQTETWKSEDESCTKIILGTITTEMWEEETQKCTRSLDASGNEASRYCEPKQ